jgi:UDPglucose 6-dehydrogenase
MKISVFGAGYVGLVTSACLADFGHDLICVDIDKEKIDSINRGVSPIYEVGLNELLKKNKDHLKVTDNARFAVLNSDITFLCVGTPSRKDGSIDLSYIKKVAEQIGSVLRQKDGHLVVVKSTVVPGTTREVVCPILEKQSGKKVGSGFGIAMNPEFLCEGRAVQDFFKPDRVVIGTTDERSATLLQQLYKDVNCPKMFTGLSEAEMIKYASNAFLATKISFINEIGNICKKLDIDTYDVAEGMGLDKRIGRAFLDSGVGWGGSCFPKDVRALIAKAKEIGETPKLLEEVVQVNETQPLKLIEVLKTHVSNLSGKEIGILGLAFKKDTDDIRESRAIPVIKKLLEEKAIVKVYDPQAMDNIKEMFPSITYGDASEVLASKAVLILTDWDEFKQLDYKGKLVIDGRRVEEAKQGIYDGICW